MKIGFIGLGIMGKPMAANLLKAGYELTVYDIDASAVEAATARGAKAAASAAEAARRSDVVVTMLPNSPHVRAAVLGAGGVLEGASEGLVIVDMSSIAPGASQEIAAACAEKGVVYLDCPVSGGEPKAVDGTLSIMCGGDAAAFERVKPLLLSMGASAVHVGAVGSGNTTKLANQIIVACNIAALSEALTLAVKAGVDPEKVFEAIKGGLAGSTVMNAKAPMMLARNFAPGFRIDLHIKDLTNTLETGASVDTPLPMTTLALDMMKVLRADGKDKLDHSALVQYYEKIADVTVAPRE